MADVADQLIQLAQSQITKPGDTDAIGNAVKVAQFVKNTQLQREKLNQNRKKLDITRLGQYKDSLERVHKSKTPAERKFWEKDATAKYTSWNPDANPRNLELVFAAEDTRRKTLSVLNDALAKSGGEFTPEVEAVAREAYNGDETGYAKFVEERNDEQRSIKKAEISAGARIEQAKLSSIDRLRGELSRHKTTTNTIVVSRNAGNIKTGFSSESAAGDLQGIFAFMKMVDPDSTVREGEFATASNAGGVEDKIVNLYNKVRKGTRLSTRQRKDFLAQADGLLKEQGIRQSKLNAQFRGIAKLRGIDPRQIIITAGLPPEQPQDKKTVKPPKDKPTKLDKFIAIAKDQLSKNKTIEQLKTFLEKRADLTAKQIDEILDKASK